MFSKFMLMMGLGITMVNGSHEALCEYRVHLRNNSKEVIHLLDLIVVVEVTLIDDTLCVVCPFMAADSRFLPLVIAPLNSEYVAIAELLRHSVLLDKATLPENPLQRMEEPLRFVKFEEIKAIRSVQVTQISLQQAGKKQMKMVLPFVRILTSEAPEAEVLIESQQDGMVVNVFTMPCVAA